MLITEIVKIAKEEYTTDFTDSHRLFFWGFQLSGARRGVFC
jgi:hypothetical protein